MNNSYKGRALIIPDRFSRERLPEGPLRYGNPFFAATTLLGGRSDARPEVAGDDVHGGWCGVHGG